MHGPRGCSCWTPVHDLEQETPTLLVQPTVRAKCCHDCAYLPTSTERSDGYTDELMDIAGDGSTFVCHQGMRRIVAWRHPDGRELPAGEGDYDPPRLGAAAFKADGSPGELCAGWAAHRARLLDPDSA